VLKREVPASLSGWLNVGTINGKLEGKEVTAEDI